jgi:cell division transport system permease protein
MFTSLARLIKSGCLNSWRNKWLSVATILVMGLAIFGITTLLLINVLIDSLITYLEDKVDVSVYFNLGVSEEQVLSVRDSLVELSQVKSVEYISTEEALNNFKEKHRDNQVLMQSLQELDSNPLEAALNIKAQVTSQYESIVSFLEKKEYQEIIDKINYQENRIAIVRLASITNTIRQVGFVILLILAVLAVLVTFNTIRLTIYSARKEIKVMKLVGASNWFIRGPFIVEGAIYGIIAVALTLTVFVPLLWYFSPRITGYLPGTDLFYFFQTNFLTLLLVQLITGILMGTISSLIAIHRYLEN